MILSAGSLVHISQLSFCLLFPCWPEDKHPELKWDSARNSELQHIIVASSTLSQQPGFCFIPNYFPPTADKTQSLNISERQRTQRSDEEILTSPNMPQR